MLKVGILGCGFMGWIHWNAYQQTEGIEVAAICTKEAHRLAGDWTDIKGNFGPPGKQVDLSKIATYSDMEEFVKNDALDLVDICLPPALHAAAIELAAAAGKQVFCEKPLGLNVEQCDRAVTACGYRPESTRRTHRNTRLRCIAGGRRYANCSDQWFLRCADDRNEQDDCQRSTEK